jgi:hypothetical protein
MKKKKPSRKPIYTMSKEKAIDKADPIANLHRDEDEKSLYKCIEEPKNRR